MQPFDEQEDSAAEYPAVFPDAQFAAPVPSVRDGWVAAREGYTDIAFEMRPDSALIPGSRHRAAIV
jgi:hypothetical protein